MLHAPNLNEHVLTLFMHVCMLCAGVHAFTHVNVFAYHAMQLPGGVHNKVLRDLVDEYVTVRENEIAAYLHQSTFPYHFPFFHLLL